MKFGIMDENLQLANVQMGKRMENIESMVDRLKLVNIQTLKSNELEWVRGEKNWWLGKLGIRNRKSSCKTFFHYNAF